MHSKIELEKALNDMLAADLEPWRVWGALHKALSYGDLRIRFKGDGIIERRKIIIYSRLTKETVLTLRNFVSPRDIAIKMLDIVKRN